MECIESRNLFSTELSDNAVSTETAFCNGEPIPSTSAGLTNLLTLKAHVPREIKNDSLRRAYLKLGTIFPKVDSKFIKETYIRKSSDENLREEEDILQTVIDDILKNGEKDFRFEISLGTSEPKINVDDQLQYLSSVFPDANPLYLKTVALKSCDGPGALEKFVEEKLETRDYPTKENYVPTRNKKGIQQQEYVDSFNMEEFLNKVTDPIKVFENPERKYTYDVVMFELLKNHFRKLKISTISDTYTRCSFNTLSAVESLQGMKFEIKKQRKKTPIKTENSQVLLEFLYATNKQRIRNYINQKKEREQKLFQKMKDNKELLECECCYEELFDSPTLIITCGEGHVFCNMCITKATEAELAKGAIRIACLTECNSEFSLVSLQKILKPATFKILVGKIQEQEITAAKIEGLVSCPFCHFALIPPANEKVFKCFNPDCGRESCRLCKKPNHLPEECEILEKSKKARLILEEKMTAALVRKCGKCGCEFVKNGGCNVVTCSCGATNCYSCGQLSISHTHLNGSCNTLITSDMDAEAVVYVAKKVESELLKSDPTLKINADSILPMIPEGSYLFQNDATNEQLPAHILRTSALQQL